MQHIVSFFSTVIATGFYSGYFPLFPGTVGSFIGALLLWFTPFQYYYILLIIVLIAGTWAAEKVSQRVGKDRLSLSWTKLRE